MPILCLGTFARANAQENPLDYSKLRGQDTWALFLPGLFCCLRPQGSRPLEDTHFFDVAFEHFITSSPPPRESS